ncbi:MAG: tetratricopeptide repeat protein [Alphaproteobacteria bacterium]|nr:tetratricopeptide repeat protein [Alphaproteobacteria bacterium]
MSDFCGAEKEIMQSDHLIALINEKNNQAEYQSALELVLPVLNTQQTDYSLWIGAGNAYYGLKQFDKAEQAYLKAADLNSTDAAALSNLAGVCFETARFAEGLNICDQALARQPEYLNALIHRGNMLSSLNRYDEASEAYRKALEIAPEDSLASFNLAYALVMTGQTDAAEKIYRQLLELSPKDEEYLFAYASFLEKKEAFAQAAEIYLRLLQIKEDPTVHITLSGCLYNLQLQNKTEDVMRLTDEWLSLFPDNPAAQHMLETLNDAADVKRASAAYVQELFDAFADSFDSVLEGLNYQAPALIASAVKELAFDPTLSVLDLGCGTGLCAAAMAAQGLVPSNLTGVDLSAEMLKKAAQRKLYADLIQDDIISFLPLHQDQFDLVVSADVLTYLGDLSPVFSGLSAAVKSGGRVVFTVSENTVDDADYALEPSGRFMHGKSYILNELRKNHFIAEKVLPVELREELGQPVYGLLTIGKKI